MMMFKTHMQK